MILHTCGISDLFGGFKADYYEIDDVWKGLEGIWESRWNWIDEAGYKRLGI